MAGGGGHRSTLKQKNKSHNHGKHRSKRNLKREAHGKVNVKQLTKDKKLKDLLRQEALQRQMGGRGDMFNERRSVAVTPPRLVVLVSLHASVPVDTCLTLLKEADVSAKVNLSEQNVVHVNASQLKKRISIVAPEYGDFQALLDAVKVADVVLFLVGDGGFDAYGKHCLAAIMGQGVPAHVFAYQGLATLSKKKTSDAKKLIEKQIEQSFPGEKARPLESWQDAQALWRQMNNLAVKALHLRENRPYLMAEQVKFEPNSEDDQQGAEETQLGTLTLSGYLRGRQLSVNQLVHVPGWGDFQMSHIDQLEDPYPLVTGNKDRRKGSKDSAGNDQEMCEAVPKMCRLATATNPESLQSEVVPDDMDQEQTWPTAEELGEVKADKKIKTLKGVSDYQSNWILDINDDDDSNDDDSEDDDMDDDATKNTNSDDNPDEEEEIDEGLDTATEVDDTEDYDEGMDVAEEKKMYEQMKEERLHVHFPDEVDTPLDTPARVRFARYRGLDSFHAAHWDPNDMLPFDYARIYRVSKHHYKRLKKLSVAAQEEDEDLDNLPAEPGQYVAVHVRNVPKSFMDFHKVGQPVTLFGLFKNEQKMTLVSALVGRVPGFKAPVKAKEPLVFQVGFRRFSACPIFSEHAHQNKFKMERFLPQKGMAVASIYAPIMFAPVPVLVFRENVLQKFDLVAKGSLLPLDTDRIVIKRVVLSGAPFKINKKTVTVRYMFFNREDIDFYKPIELRTKWGKRGHIKQALGTHGHMKCTFNGQLKSEDTVLMNLYKRVFPKWSFDPHVSLLPPARLGETEDGSQQAEEEMVEEAEQTQGAAYGLFD